MSWIASGAQVPVGVFAVGSTAAVTTMEHEPGGVADGVDRLDREHFASTARQEAALVQSQTDKATGLVLVVLIILYVGSQLVSTLLMFIFTP